jgi:uridine kinase
VGTTPVVVIDGFSGAGKTTLARELRRAADDVTVQSIEAFYLGWDGLAAGPVRAAEQLLEPLRRGAVPEVAPWDWRRGEVAPSRRRVVSGLLVLEGVGAAARPLRDAASLSVWVDAPAAERAARLREREDWATYAPHRAAFEAQEQALAAREGTRAAVDVVVTRQGSGWETQRSGARP